MLKMRDEHVGKDKKCTQKKNKVGESIWCICIIDKYSFCNVFFTLTILDIYF